MQDRGNFVIGLLMGGLVGTLVGILLAPAPGEETRRQVGAKAGDAASRLREGSARVAAQASQSVQTLSQRVRTRVGTLQAQALDGVAETMQPEEAAATGESAAEPV